MSTEFIERKVSNYLVFISNGIITYFADMFILFSNISYLIYAFFLVAVISSAILFTIFPRKIYKRPLFNFIVKVLLHSVVTYILMVVFGNLWKVLL